MATRKSATRIEFTVKKIDAISPPLAGRAEYKDSVEQGLYLRVTASGVKSFSVVGRAKGGRGTERVTLGRYPQVRPEEARKKARELAGDLAAGVSPRAAARKRKGEMTVGELWKLYYAKIQKTNKSPESSQDAWTRWVEPKWAKRRLSEVSAAEVENWHLELPESILKARAERLEALKLRDEERRREIAARQAIRRRGPDPKSAEERAPVAKKVTGKVSANRALQLLRALYGFAIDDKRRYFEGRNPASSHTLHAVEERERFLLPSEMSRFFEAVAEEPNEEARDCILIAMLAGQRRFNNISMRWSEINFAEAQWRMLGEFTKNGQPHVVPLVPEAVEILKRRHDARAPGAVFVFASSRSKSGHIGAPSQPWARILKRSGITNLVFHDLRRTLGSWLARGGASLLMIGKTLNHKSPEAAAVYARLDLDPVRQSMGAATTAMFEAASAKKTATVHELPLPSKKRSGRTAKGA